MDYHKISSFVNKLFNSKLFFFLEVVVSAVLGITLVFPVLGILVALNELVRLCYKFYLWRKYGDSVKLNEDEIGTNYMLMPTENRHTVIYLGEFVNTITVDHIREKYQKHVIESKEYSRFTYMIEKNFLYSCMRKCDTFDIKNHIRYYPGTEERTVTEDELIKKILPDLAQDMTDDKPRWEEVIIPFYKKPQPNLNAKADSDTVKEETGSQKTISLRIIRMHHAYMDGASVLILIANKFCGEGTSFPYVINPCKPLKIPKLSMFLYKLSGVVLLSATVIRYMLRPPILRTSRFSVNWNSNGKILFGWTNKISIDYFRSIKEKSGVSMPSIISSTLSGALRSLALKYPRCDDTMQSEGQTFEVPGSLPIWIVAAMFPYSSKKPGNKHTVVEAQVDTSDISGCKRLAIMNNELGRLVKNPDVLINYWIEKLVGRIPTPISKLIISMSACPVLLSNIPLCTRNIKMWGNECTYISGWVPLLAKTGLGIVSVRYADHIRYCIQADSNVMSQDALDYFARQIEHHVEQLFLETAQLKRRISTELSSFDHGEENHFSTSRDDNSKISQIENHNAEILTNSVNNNNAKAYEGSMRRASTSINYSIMFKLKDCIAQFIDGIIKIKQQ